MTLYRATHNGPLPGTLSDTATGCILKAFRLGYSGFGWEAVSARELKHELEAK